MDSLVYLKKPGTWLLAIAIALVALHLTILEQEQDSNLMSLNILLWLGVASLVWDKRQDLTWESNVFSSFLGATLIAIVLLRALSPAGYHLMVSPLVFGVGLCLMASGIKNLRDYWKELLILSLLALYPILSAFLRAIDITTLTAKATSFMLWATGFEAQREGVFIILPTGRVEVYSACAGIDIAILMFSIAVMFLLMVSLSRLQQVICIVVAVLIGFVVNAMRAALLAVLTAFRNPQGFDYWHGGTGSFIFSVISVSLFGIFCWFAYVRQLTLTEEMEES